MLYVPFSNFFQMRRDTFATVTAEDKGTFYTAQAVLPDGRTILTNIGKGTADGNYFEQYYLSKCNSVVQPDVLDLITHDFSSNTWVNPDSCFTWLPSPNKVIELQEVKTSCWRDLDFGQNTIVMAIWEGITQECPEYSFTGKTAYNSDNTWAGVWPPPYYAGQEVSVYIKYGEILGQQIPLYKVTEFVYQHPRRIRQKARLVTNHTVSEDPLIYETEAWYPYKERKVRIALRDSMNERVECFLSSATPLSNGASEIPSTAAAVFHSYDEW